MKHSLVLSLRECCLQFCRLSVVEIMLKVSSLVARGVGAYVFISGVGGMTSALNPRPSQHPHRTRLSREMQIRVRIYHATNLHADVDFERWGNFSKRKIYADFMSANNEDNVRLHNSQVPLDYK